MCGVHCVQMVLNADLVDPAFLTGPSLPAALRAVHGACKATALGWAVVVGQWGWLKPMLDVCRSATQSYVLLMYACVQGIVLYIKFRDKTK